MEITLGNEGPCCNVQGKESFRFCKTKAVLKTNSKSCVCNCAHHLLKTNGKPIASLTVHTTSGVEPSILRDSGI